MSEKIKKNIIFFPLLSLSLFCVCFSFFLENKGKKKVKRNVFGRAVFTFPAARPRRTMPNLRPETCEEVDEGDDAPVAFDAGKIFIFFCFYFSRKVVDHSNKRRTFLNSFNFFSPSKNCVQKTGITNNDRHLFRVQQKVQNELEKQKFKKNKIKKERARARRNKQKKREGFSVLTSEFLNHSSGHHRHIIITHATTPF